MSYNVLILDDDADFNSLLTDIFEQADYVVSSLEDPLEALEVFESNDYDLVVTDHKMPEMTGTTFTKKVKQMRPEVPVIMVSGYLENDTIRELISEGVGGVFLKPLNIFSLLERTAELIEEARKAGASSEDADAVEEAGSADAGGPEEVGERYAFRSFPRKSKTSAEFAERLCNLRNFKSTLSLIGEPGTHFRAICEDIRGFYDKSGERFVYLTAASFDSAQTLSKVEEAAEAGAERVTCVLLDIEAMDDGQKELAVALPKCAAPFNAVEVDLRVIFCVHGDLDTLFDEGKINENLYILMGTAEVRVPSLRDCAEDIPVMAQQILADIAKERGMTSVPQFEKSAHEFLKHNRWEGNYAELAGLLRRLIERQKPDLVTRDALAAALHADVEASPGERLEAFLAAARLDFVRGASVLQGGDRARVAAFFGADTEAVGQFLAQS